MRFEKNFLENIVNITSNAAIACYPHLGKKDKVLADKAATDEMRKNLNQLDINGKVVIGEGELDEAPMLYIGEELGTGKGPSIDIAVDPLEGTNFAANNLPGALSVLAVSLKGNLFNAPETYMNKLAVGKDIPFDATDLDFTVEKNIKNIADSKNISVVFSSIPVLFPPIIPARSSGPCSSEMTSISSFKSYTLPFKASNFSPLFASLTVSVFPEIFLTSYA